MPKNDLAASSDEEAQRQRGRDLLQTPTSTLVTTTTSTVQLLRYSWAFRARVWDVKDKLRFKKDVFSCSIPFLLEHGVNKISYSSVLQTPSPLIHSIASAAMSFLTMPGAVGFEVARLKGSSSDIVGS